MDAPSPPAEEVRVVRINRIPADVLADIAELDLGDAVVTERGRSYLVIGSSGTRPRGPGAAVTLFVLAVLAVLVVTAFDVAYIALLPLAPLPLILLLFSRRRLLAVAALPGEGGSTVVTVSGTGRAGLVRALHRHLDREAAAAPSEAELDAAAGPPDAAPAAGAEPGADAEPAGAPAEGGSPEAAAAAGSEPGVAAGPPGEGAPAGDPGPPTGPDGTAAPPAHPEPDPADAGGA